MGKKRPSTRRWKVLVLIDLLLPVDVSVLALCQQVSRCLVIADLLNSLWQSAQIPLEICLILFSLLFDLHFTA